MQPTVPVCHEIAVALGQRQLLRPAVRREGDGALTEVGPGPAARQQQALRLSGQHGFRQQLALHGVEPQIYALAVEAVEPGAVFVHAQQPAAAV